MATNHPINTDHMVASCGHNDILGYLLHTVCGDCAKKGHRMVVRNRPATKRKAKVTA